MSTIRLHRTTTLTPEQYVAGLTDFVFAPFRPAEVVSRVTRALEGPPRLGSMQAGNLILDTASRRALIDDRVVDLTSHEFELLHILLANAGRVLPRETLIDRVWGTDYVGDTKTLDVHVKRLRSKIEDDPANPTRIVTIRGLGYKYEKPR